MRLCLVAGCDRPATTYSTLCTLHKKRKARHGDPLQRPVRAKELKPCAKAAVQWLDQRSRHDARDLLNRLWQNLIQEAQIYLEKAQGGHPYQRNMLSAYQTVLRVAEGRTADEVLGALLGMGYLYKSNPRRFVSETAFGYQVARRFRALADCSIGISWDNRRQKTRKVYRDVSPKTLRALWSILLESKLPLYGMRIATKDLAERSRWRPTEDIVTAAVLGSRSDDGSSVSQQLPEHVFPLEGVRN